MLKSTIIITCLIFIIFFSCNNYKNSGSDVTLKQWYYEDSTLKKEIEFINDSIMHGTYRFFYPSGVLQDSAQILYNKFHGQRFEYHENGQIHMITTYINNKYRNGLDFRPNGTLIFYKAYNYHENLMFIASYDSLGVMEKHDGNLIYSWVQEKEYPIGEEFSVELLVANPPNCKTEVLISDWDNEQKRSINNQKYFPDEFNRVVYKRMQNPENDLHILHIVTISDTIAQTTLNDTLMINVAKNGKSTYTRNFPE